MMRVLPFLLTVALPALASESEHEGHGGGHGGIPWATLLFSTINLCIFGWIMARFAVPSVKTWVRERREQIVRDLEAAATARGEALRLKAEWEARMAKLDDEIAALRAEARDDIERERQRILAAANASAANVRRDAERIAAAEAQQLAAQLQAEVARKAISLAENTIRSQWTGQDQERLVSDFLKHVQP